MNANIFKTKTIIVAFAITLFLLVASFVYHRVIIANLKTETENLYEAIRYLEYDVNTLENDLADKENRIEELEDELENCQEEVIYYQTYEAYYEDDNNDSDFWMQKYMNDID
jgi:cell division protein FtsB